MSKLFNELSKLNTASNKVTFVPSSPSENDQADDSEQQKTDLDIDQSGKDSLAADSSESTAPDVGEEALPNKTPEPADEELVDNFHNVNVVQSETVDTPHSTTDTQDTPLESDDEEIESSEEDEAVTLLTDQQEKEPDASTENINVIPERTDNTLSDNDSSATTGIPVQVEDEKPARTLFRKRNIFVALIILLIVFLKLFSGNSEDPPIDMVLPEEPKAEAPALQDAAIQSTPLEAQAPSIETALNELLESWKTAWQLSSGSEGNIDNYMNHYSDDFYSSGMSKKQWQQKKGRINKGKTWIEVFFADISINPGENQDLAEVRFSQEYSSSNYTETSRKIIIVRKEDGAWKILSEEAE